MKNILIIIALFAFLDSYATDPLSWGKKGGSGGVTQSQLDAKVDTSLIITGQEALDSLSANIARTDYGYISENSAINSVYNDSLAGGNLWFNRTQISGHLVLTDGTLKACAVKVDIGKTIIGFQYWIGGGTASFIEDNYNGVGLYSTDGTGTITLEAQSLNNANFLKRPGGSFYRVYFTSGWKAVNGICYAAFLMNYSSQTSLPYLGYFDLSALLYNTNIYLLDGTTSSKGNFYILNQTSLPSTINVTTQTASSSCLYVQPIYAP